MEENSDVDAVVVSLILIAHEAKPSLGPEVSIRVNQDGSWTVNYPEVELKQEDSEERQRLTEEAVRKFLKTLDDDFGDLEKIRSMEPVIFLTLEPAGGQAGVVLPPSLLLEMAHRGIELWVDAYC